MSARTRLLAVTGTAAALATMFALPAGAASAKPGNEVGAAHASCGTTAPDKDSSPWLATARTAAKQRSGSSTSCAALGTVQTSDRLDYHCFTYGNDNYTWTYLRNDRTDVAGWVRDDLLKDGGSGVRC
ncbi:SH3 domain-containing protein [Actinosynnema sp. NPDC050801]|uniref:SH3 domain-containing protein n=1 Tax=unclassified Actinosynnema TaxID=2637065 RepID=UPI0033C0A5F7